MIKEFPENNQRPVAQNEQVTGAIIKAIENCNRILISAHVRLDGDAIGSEIAMYHALKNLGKEPTIINDSLIPRVYAFLPETALFVTSEDLTETLNDNYELVIALDSPSPDRFGKICSIFSRQVTVINIDHHVSNSNFGNINLVCPESSSTGEIVLRLLKETSQK
ncbi:MAG: DHH family phosphoesterase, partial [Candidatus Brocadiales bacterium]